METAWVRRAWASVAKDKPSVQLSKAQPQSVKGQQQERQPAPAGAEIWHFGKVQGFKVEM